MMGLFEVPKEIETKKKKLRIVSSINFVFGQVDQTRHQIVKWKSNRQMDRAHKFSGEK